MLTDVNVIRTGQSFPLNEDMEERKTQLHQYEELYEGEHVEVFEEQFKRITRVVGNFEDIIGYFILFNYHRAISKKTMDLLLGERPTITGKTQSTTNYINEKIEELDLWDTLEEAVIDLSRYGDSILRVYKIENEIRVSIVPTQYWIPVVDANDIKRVTNHIIAYTKTEGKNTILYTQVHYKGMYEEKIYQLESSRDCLVGQKIGRLLSSTQVYTGLTDFAIIPISNITSSSSIYGTSDYEDVNSIISELEVRVEQIVKILDKHSDPSIILPGEVLSRDRNTGLAVARTGEAFVLNNPDSVIPSYMTWDAQLEANYKMIQLLLDQLSILSELGNLFLGNGMEKLGNISGTALKKMAYNAICKINRLQRKLQPAIIKVLKAVAELDGVNLSNERINISFGDVLPQEWQELIDSLVKAVAGNIMSQETAIRKLNENMSEESIQAEIALIKSISKGVDVNV